MRAPCARRNAALVAGLALAVTMAGCNGRPTAPTFNASMLPSDARNANTSLVVGAVTYELDGFLWRDFMPVSEPDGSPLFASIGIRASGGPMPADFRLTSVAIVFGDRMWMPKTSAGIPSDDLRSYHASGGPRWGPGVPVDLYAFVSVGGSGRWLRKAAVTIQRTD